MVLLKLIGSLKITCITTTLADNCQFETGFLSTNYQFPFYHFDILIFYCFSLQSIVKDMNSHSLQI